MWADGGEAVEVRKREGPAKGTSEEDGRHGLRGCSEVGVFGGRRGELVRMRSKRRRRGAVARRVIGGFQPRAEPPWSPRLFGGRRAGLDAEQPAKGTSEEDGRHGLRGCSEVGVFGGRRGELVRMRSKRRRRGAVARRVIGGFQPRAEPPWSPRLFGGRRA